MSTQSKTPKRITVTVADAEQVADAIESLYVTASTMEQSLARLDINEHDRAVKFDENVIALFERLVPLLPPEIQPLTRQCLQYRKEAHENWMLSEAEEM